VITNGVIPLPSRIATALHTEVAHPRARAILRRQLRGELDNIVLHAQHRLTLDARALLEKP
jgi:hypothetical protein